MTRSQLYRALGVALLLVIATAMNAQAQVIETREGESNPGLIIFRATLAGGGAGALIGAGIGLINDDSGRDLWNNIKKGAGWGAVGGAVIGVIWVIARPEPQPARGDVDVDVDAHGHRHDLRLPSMSVEQVPDLFHESHTQFRLGVVNIGF